MKHVLLQNLNTRLTIFILLTIIITGIHWLILTLKIPVFHLLPYSMFLLRDTPVNYAWMLLAASILLAATSVRYGKANNFVKVFVIFLAGLALQFSFAFSKNHGLDALRERMINSGHAEFAIVASQLSGVLETASHYEDIARKNGYQYIPSKPPGTLLFYMINARIAASLFSPSDSRLDNLQTFASITWPVFTYFVVFLIYALAKEIFKSEVALNASLLYISIPSVNLITLHADQTLYPFLATLPILVAVIAFQKNNPWLCFLSGVLYYVAVFFSFGLIVTGVLFIVPFFSHVFMKGFPKHLRDSLLLLLTAITGAVMADMLARLIIRYDIYLRYTNAMKHHLSWKGWENTLQTFVNANITNILEYVLWIGIPISLLFLFEGRNSMARFLTERRMDSRSIFAAVLAGVFLLLLLVGKTKAETARLWVFLLPFVCIASAECFERVAPTVKSRRATVFLILFMEFGTAYFTLRHQDFF
jgi:hypothetical protein